MWGTVRKILISIFLILSLSLLNFQFSSISAIGDECLHPLVIFARGSSQPLGKLPGDIAKKPETYKFFDEIKSRANGLEVATEELEYDAVGGIENMLGAKLSWSGVGQYQHSANRGVSNLLAEISTKVQQCPDRKIILGGYSQGAQVVGDSLYLLGDSYTKNISYIALFGDPRFNPTSYAAQGSFSGTNGGVLGMRSEYPAKFTNKIGSWCLKGDPICASNYATLSLEFLNHPSAHHDYPIQTVSIGANYAALALKHQALASFASKPVPIDPQKKLDVVYALDTSSTMRFLIPSLVSNVDAMISDTKTLAPDIHVGLVIYNDQLDSCGLPFPVTVVPLTSDTALFRSKLIQQVDTCGGFPDDTYSGLIAAINQNWRPDAQRLVVLLGGNTPHETELKTGYTANTVINAARSSGAVIDSVIRGNSLLSINAHQPIINAVGGRVLFMPDGNTSEFFRMYDYLHQLLNGVPNDPIAKLNTPLPTQPGQPVLFNAGASYDPNSSITSYQWDFNNDQVYDQTTSQPVVSHVYNSVYHGLAAVRVIADDGGAGVASATVSVDSINSIPHAPNPPGQVTASLNSDNSVRVHWQTSSSGDVDHYIVHRDNGDTLSLAEPSTQEVDIDNLPRGQSMKFSVAAQNAIGVSTETMSNAITIPEPDNTPPSITPTVTPSPNANGWNNSSVMVRWDVSDGQSPVSSSSGCGEISITDETNGLVLTCQAVSDGGTNSQSVTVKIDKAKPLIDGQRSPQANASSWNNNDVEVIFSCEDVGSVQSGIGSNTVLGDTVTNEGVNMSVTNTGSCVDLAGNEADSSTISDINIDKTVPKIIINKPTEGNEYLSTEDIFADWNVTDLLAGLDGDPIGTIASGDRIPLLIGKNDFLVIATDRAGNTNSKKVSYSVLALSTSVTPPGDSVSNPLVDEGNVSTNTSSPHPPSNPAHSTPSSGIDQAGILAGQQTDNSNSNNSSGKQGSVLGAQVQEEKSVIRYVRIGLLGAIALGFFIIGAILHFKKIRQQNS